MTTAKKTILVVDDDPDILLQVTAILSNEGYAVHSAGTAAEAEELLLSLCPDLAVIDLMMEQKDSGFILCHQIRKLHPHTPVMMLTAVKAATGMSFAAGRGEAGSWLEADLLVDKPIRPEQLTSDVRRLLKRAKDAEKTVEQ